VIFHSLDFVIFFVAIVAAYWLLPRSAQNVLLLVASYFFYGYVHPWFLILIAASTIVDYFAARGMEVWPAYRKQFVWLSIASNFGMLGFFKYFNFFVENVHAALNGLGIETSLPALRVVLPVGISFYTFQALSYTIDVYRGELRARRNLLDVAVFISFFPHLVAGPIQRASYLLPQVESPRWFSFDKARSGLVLICWGFFKKLVIADNVGVIANKVFSVRDPSFWLLWSGVFAFAIQIYADFSAYTDIARGTSRWLGFELTQNFDHPYCARSPADFWRRWNISLSSWFRDYVYIPLGGSRAGRWIWVRNVLATFLLSGLWHGASWNYVLWGLYHGVLLVITRRSFAPRAPQPTLSRAASPARAVRPARFARLARVITRTAGTTQSHTTPPAWIVASQIAGMFFLTNVGWLLFRETSLAAIIHDLSLSPWVGTALDRQTAAYLFILSLVYSLPLWIESLWVELRRALVDSHEPPLATHTPWPRLALQAIGCGVAFTAILVLRSRTSLDFIYFHF
jgi:D-alanyl-lipoteichoic acid acyltransferase DltB (MBOAT superfamily)